MQKTILGGLRAPVRLSLLSAASALALGALSTQALALGGGIPTTPNVLRVAADPRIVDHGAAAATDVKSISVALAVRNQAALDAFVAGVADPKNANFRKFITPAQFAATYGQTPAAIAQVVSYLQSKGLSITTVHANGLLISAKGTNAQIAAAFGTTIHSYTLDGVTYQAPATKAVLPASIASIATAVTGLSNKASFHTHKAQIPNTGALAAHARTTSLTPCEREIAGLASAGLKS